LLKLVKEKRLKIRKEQSFSQGIPTRGNFAKVCFSISGFIGVLYLTIETLKRFLDLLNESR